MATAGGPKKITDGLVVSFDAANDKSFRGEPTTNVVTNTNLDTGWSKNYQTNISFNEIKPPDGIDSPVVGFDRGNASGYWYSYGNFAPKVPNNIYTVSMYVKTLDSNFNIRYYTADNSETGRVWGSNISVPNDGNWHRVVWTSFTNPSNSQSDSLSFNFTYAGSIGSPSTRTWFCASQMESKSYSTPFVNGTRGTTVATGGGWVDRAGNNNHGELVNGPTFNSSNLGSLVFDGTNQRINLTSFSVPFLTLSTWVFRTSTVSNQGICRKQNGWVVSIFNGFLQLAPGTSWQFYNTGYVIPLNTWVNITYRYIGSGSNSQSVFINGVLIWTNPNGSGSLPTNSNQVRIGFDDNNWWWGGRISQTQIYNRALTDVEVLQNFNATKNRYGL